jgi:two-component system sensor histidine kinase KdpD
LIGYQTVGLILLFAILLLALFIGRGPVLLSAAFSALLWNFFFIPPAFTFSIAAPQDVLMFVMYFVIASILGNLTSRIRAQQFALQRREAQATALYTLAREVVNAANLDEVLMVAVKQLSVAFSARIALLLPDQASPTSLKLHPTSTLRLNEKDHSVAAWVFEQRKPAGRFTDTLPMAEAFFVPLFTPNQAVGVIGLRTHRAEPLSLEQKALLETFASQIAGAIKRMLLLASPSQH